MHKHDSVEIRLIPTVKRFCQEHYPDCTVIFHPSVYFSDPTFKHPGWDLAVPEARAMLGTNPQTKTICEVTPDYGLFRTNDIIGIRLFTGRKNKRALPLIRPGTDLFIALTEFCDPIPYMVWESVAPADPKGMLMMVVLKDGAYPVAVVDHKGGKTYNISKQRIKAVTQARRFGAKECYMLTESRPPEPVRLDGAISVEQRAVYSDCTIWRMG
ncbi:MAG TPA: hypothetical protein P5204_08205 [Kiritimatiellia bacterium]|nr:hypothetical protein [Kiritimatiellia bacterium]